MNIIRVVRGMWLMLLSCLVVGLLNAQGFVAGTLVKIPAGYIPIEQIKKHDEVMVYHENEYVERRVICVISSKIQYFYRMLIDGQSIDLAPDQKLYLPEVKQWVDVEKMTSDQSVYTNRGLRYVDDIIRIDEEVDVFDFSVEISHSFCVTTDDIVVHNFAPVLIGLSFFIEAWAIEFAGLSVATAIAGIGAGIIVHNKDGNKKVELKLSDNPDDITAGGGAPEDPEEKRKKNETSKSQFFNRREIKRDYEHYKRGIYRKKRGSKGLDNAEYLQWDHLHNDIEAYTSRGIHLGSIDPKTLRFYKKAVRNRTLW